MHPPSRDYYLGGLDDMSAWTSLVWQQASTALLQGTGACDIPHNTIGLSCGAVEDRMDWVVGMLGKNLRHHATDLSFLGFLPTEEDLEVMEAEKEEKTVSHR